MVLKKKQVPLENRLQVTCHMSHDKSKINLTDFSADITTPCLCHIFNLSVSNGYVPQEWKKRLK